MYDQEQINKIEASYNEYVRDNQKLNTFNDINVKEFNEK